MRALVVANREDPETGMIGDALAARGVSFVRAWRNDKHEPIPAPTDHDLVLVLGSEWSTYWPHLAPEVEREATFLKAALADDVPVLAICYGAQILTHALGGIVERAPDGGEVGWYAIDSEVPELIPTGPYMQWHVDRFQPPDGATEYARSACGSQAYTWGSALAVQFHPEVTPAIAERWGRGGARTLADRNLHLDELIAVSRAYEADAVDRAATLVDTFLDRRLSGS